jgi:hypothetical protein
MNHPVALSRGLREWPILKEMSTIGIVVTVVICGGLLIALLLADGGWLD